MNLVDYWKSLPDEYSADLFAKFLIPRGAMNYCQSEVGLDILVYLGIMKLPLQYCFPPRWLVGVMKWVIFIVACLTACFAFDGFCCFLRKL